MTLQQPAEPIFGRVFPYRPDTGLIQDWLGHRAIQHRARYTELSPVRFKDVWR
jgi:hypothetical protein